MKIAISTINDYTNYGNRLQNYALQYILEKEGHSVKTIRNYHISKESRINRIKKLRFNKITLHKVINKLKRKKNSESEQYLISKKEKFQKFTEKYIHETEKIIYNENESISFDDDFDCFVIGSDQVWNYSFPRFSSLDFLYYTDKPKISYAASFGVNEIPHNYKNQYKIGLNSINFISVREREGATIVENIIHKKVNVVLDPTLMVSKSEWSQLITGKSKYKDKYILTYFLDKPSEVDREYIKNFAKKNQLDIKNLISLDSNIDEIYDPTDFVNLFYQAEAVFTDSFHACVFSIIFEKYFEVFERNTGLPSMNSRIDTLFEMLGLDDRWHNNGIVKDEIDYQRVKKQLAIKQSESMKFLTESLAAVENKSQ